MINAADADKAAWRARIHARLAGLGAEERRAASAAICAALVASPVWRTARAVGLYFALPDEPDLGPLIGEALRAGRLVAVPRWNAAAGAYGLARIQDMAADCGRGRFGILEPRPELPAVAVRRLDLVLVPGVAFDRCGRRLGRGGGFYDRLLAGHRGVRLGVCFAEQFVAELPALPHDVGMSFLAIPAGLRPAAAPG
ncbi:MAG TPA: 5-formyltetrahydrofolate cyclo-ligase [Verrucomicrobiota bacterium]|nr:5-formyltetrahydrofolate cyclo-ligase [Verrucomicrobiota bacterium]